MGFKPASPPGVAELTNPTPDNPSKAITRFINAGRKEVITVLLIDFTTRKSLLRKRTCIIHEFSSVHEFPVRERENVYEKESLILQRQEMGTRP